LSLKGEGEKLVTQKWNIGKGKLVERCKQIENRG
jgi:hypothetical protein